MIGKLEEKDKAVSIEIREGRVWLTLRDSRIVSMPLGFFPWLEQATPEQRANYEFAPFSIYWPDLDDGIDVYAFVTGSWVHPPALRKV
ncbi:DUF2442 domain-containing protein [Aggregatilinea lenta]|uniref:DUF2442 domain-containing protein n=1 Tax=Aggregatilinea lenta TaxID=913108 RepID=UPI000E5A9928|nr:DUF2442 domain-containing protein [Aggregatilinea lenta]